MKDKMKVTFPHMGKIYIPLKAILEELKVDVIVPPICSKKTISIGMKLSPEGMCLPFKINIGNFVESIELGANTIIMIQSCGDKCRIGMFSQLQENILKDAGYDIRMVSVKPFGTLKEINRFIQILGELANIKNRIFLYKAFIQGIRLLLKTDEFFALVNKIRAIEFNKGDTEEVINRMERDVKQVRGYHETLIVLKKAKKDLLQISRKEEVEPLRIGLIGEIYVLAEEYTNMFIEKHLGDMGVEVHKVMTTSEFIKRHLDFIPFIKSDIKKIYKDGKPYLNKNIGGHTLETVGSAVMYKKKKYDGIIHILPFGCMPEIMSEGILKKVKEVEDIPIMTMVFDELTGETGFITRLEAFVDCLEREREKKKGRLPIINNDEKKRDGYPVLTKEV